VVEATTVEELLVFPKLRLDAIDAVVAQLAEVTIVTPEELEQKLPGLWFARKPSGAP
jgi:hypothetical protein